MRRRKRRAPTALPNSSMTTGLPRYQASFMWASNHARPKAWSVLSQLSGHMWMEAKSMPSTKWLGRKSCPVCSGHAPPPPELVGLALRRAAFPYQYMRA